MMSVVLEARKMAMDGLSICKPGSGLAVSLVSLALRLRRRLSGFARNFFMLKPITVQQATYHRHLDLCMPFSIRS